MKKLFLYLLTPVLLFLGLGSVSSTVSAATELTNVITDISIWDNSNGRLAQADSSGVFNLAKNGNYSLYLKFDLSNYNNNLHDGDYFDIDVPVPFSMTSGATMELKEPDTKIAIADAVSTINGSGQGGKVRVTLKNLQQYLDAKQTTEILNIKGEMFVQVKVEMDVTNQSVTFTNIKGHL